MARRIRRAGLVPYTARERRAAAYHEAGHAVACLVLGVPFKSVTIEPGANHDGHIRYDFGRLTKAVLKTWTREQNLAHATQFLCGAAAEGYDQRYRHRQIDPCAGAKSDQEMASFLIRCIHCPIDEEVTEAQQDAMLADVDVVSERAVVLVKDNFQKIRKVALALQKRGTLTFDEIVALI
jgi:hypothetical protein